MKNRLLALGGWVVLPVVAVYAFSVQQANWQQEQQLAVSRDQLQQMLVDIEANTLRRLDYERQISELQKQLLTASNQVQTLDSQLVQAREQIDPDFQRMETDLRRRIAAENTRQIQRASQTPSTGALISALSNVDQAERMSVIAVQVQYGNFLSSLNTSEDRKNQIAQAMVNLVTQQNQARMELAQQQLEPQQMRQQMRALSDPAAAREAMSYVLTGEEMQMFEEYQQTQPNIVINATNGAGGVFTMRRGDGPRGRGPGFGPGGAGGNVFELQSWGGQGQAQGQQEVIIRQSSPAPAN